MTLKTYSRTKMVGGLTEFDERKYLIWGDFLNEISQNISSIKLSKNENRYLTEMIERGNKIQEILNNNSKKYNKYELYIRDMLNYICIQDDLINNIKSYVQELIIWKAENEKERTNKL